MKKKICLSLLLTVLMLLPACAGRHHPTDMPDPKAYNAHFGDMDPSGDGTVTWTEFKGYFPDAERKVFDAIDLNSDSGIDHDEWHEFKDAHGLRHEDHS